MSARRWPWVTLSIIVANLIVHIAVVNSDRNDEAEAAARRAIEYHLANPQLKASESLAELESNMGIDPGRTLHSTQIEPAAEPEDPEDDDGAAGDGSGDTQVSQEEALRQYRERQAELLALRQQKLDSLAVELGMALERMPMFAHGYTPAKPKLLSLLTYQFLHEGWLHLIFNMWFLWLVGCYVEDVWGRVFFPGFYLVGGALAAVAHQVATPGSTAPLIGASGAVAAAMGAFLVKYLKTKIRFWYFLLLIIKPYYGAFRAPAFVMLPLWLASQVYEALTSTSDGVAYVAHIGGFVFGAGVAVAIRLSGHEKKLDDAIEKQLTWTADPRLLDAGEQIDRGEHDAALATLEQLLREDPNRVDAHLERVRAARAKHDPVVEARAYAGAIRAQARSSPESAVELFYEAVNTGCAGEVPRELVLRLAKHLAARGESQRAIDMFCALHTDGGVDAPALQALVAHADLALAAGDHGVAVQLYEQADAAPYPHPELETVLKQKLNRARLRAQGA